MKVLNQINYVGGLGADRWIGEGLKAAFEAKGHEFFWLTQNDDWSTRLGEVRPDMVICAQGLLSRYGLEPFLRARKEGVKIVMRVDALFDADPVMAKALTEGDPADLYYGEVEHPWIDRFTEITGKPYHVIANAANAKYHFPTDPAEKYRAEIVFLGAWMPNKKEVFEELLAPLRRKYDVKLFGPNWTVADNSLRLLALGARKAKLWKLNQWISEKRITVPAEEENKLYSSAKICINIHERGAHIKNHVILNERTFKIPASGGFEVCDFVPPLRNYFTDSEMVMADDKNGDWVKDWFSKIDYYLKHDAEREEIKKRGIARAHKDHMYSARVDQMLALLGL